MVRMSNGVIIHEAGILVNSFPKKFMEISVIPGRAIPGRGFASCYTSHSSSIICATLRICSITNWSLRFHLAVSFARA